MAKISTYGPDATLTNKDKVLGSSYIRTVNNVDEFETKKLWLKPRRKLNHNINTTNIFNLRMHTGNLLTKVK